MSPESVLPHLARWVHILTAIVALGGSFFLRVILLPSAGSTLGPEDLGRLRAAVLRRWRVTIHICILLFLLSGLYNYLAITRFDHVGQGLYHGLFGVKFLIAVLAVFPLAIMLTAGGERFGAIQANAKTWLTVLIVLATAIVLISGTLKMMSKERGERVEISIRGAE